MAFGIWHVKANGAWRLALVGQTMVVEEDSSIFQMTNSYNAFSHMLHDTLLRYNIFTSALELMIESSTTSFSSTLFPQFL